MVVPCARFTLLREIPSRISLATVLVLCGASASCSHHASGHKHLDGRVAGAAGASGSGAERPSEGGSASEANAAGSAGLNAAGAGEVAHAGGANASAAAGSPADTTVAGSGGGPSSDDSGGAPEGAEGAEGGAAGAGSGTPKAGVISAGNDHSCVLLGGSIRCWGGNLYGQLGSETPSPCSYSDGTAFPCSTTPITVPGFTDTAAVGAGYEATCAMLISGTVQCWGLANSGQLGDTTTSQCTDSDGVSRLCSTTPIVASGITDATQLSVGYFHTCVTLGDGTVQCWGDNANGDLGDGTAAVSDVPVTVSGMTNAILVSAGADFTCGLLSDGTVQCWGRSDAFGYFGARHTCVHPGVLFDTSNPCNTTPVSISGITHAILVAASWDHTCVLLSGGTVQCWGGNAWGQLGDGSTTSSFDPITVSGITHATLVTVGRSHSCALLADGTVQCWGNNSDGQLGSTTSSPCSFSDGTAFPCSTTPIAVPGITDATAVAAGFGHTCALLTGGTVQCWGLNVSGQLGDGTTDNSPVPVTVKGL
jgi:alpha-tubulin suppressor-like RCC1 family protein